MKEFKKFLRLFSEAEREVTFDYSKEPRSTIGAGDTDKVAKFANILLDGSPTDRKFRLCVVYVNPRRDDGRPMDVFPPYNQPACKSVEELRALKTEVSDPNGMVSSAIDEFEKGSLYRNLTAKGE
jgi:hypothetical protein